jgi:hypothetical protein
MIVAARHALVETPSISRTPYFSGRGISQLHPGKICLVSWPAYYHMLCSEFCGASELKGFRLNSILSVLFQ